MFKLKNKDLLEVADLEAGDIVALFELAREIKTRRSRGERVVPVLKDRHLGLVFAKPSTRTRISFEAAMLELGGNVITLSTEGMQVSRGETMADTARVFSRYLDGVAVRTYRQAEVTEMAAAGSIPVINALTDRHHPCQALADFFTIWEKKRSLKGLTLAWLGDGNNVCHSLMQASVLLGVQMLVFTPGTRRPDQSVLDRVGDGPGRVILRDDPRAGLSRADVVYTDVWVSMGEEAADGAGDLFAPFRISRELLKTAPDRVMVMHCLPAHRGEEITSEVLDGPNSIVWDQAENRLHIQKALLAALL